MMAARAHSLRGGERELGAGSSGDGTCPPADDASAAACVCTQTQPNQQHARVRMGKALYARVHVRVFVRAPPCARTKHRNVLRFACARTRAQCRSITHG